MTLYVQLFLKLSEELHMHIALSIIILICSHVFVLCICTTRLHVTEECRIIAEKCDQGAEQEPNISTDIYSDHIWWLVAGGRCGHTLKINTNNARSSIPYTPYSYTSIH